MTTADSPPLYAAEFDQQIRVFIDDHREMLARCLNGLTEEQARQPLVASKTTLLGLVKHAAFVERVWCDQARTGLSRAELGIPETPDESFDLDETDTIASVGAAFAAACEESRRAVEGLSGDTIWGGNRRGRVRRGNVEAGTRLQQKRKALWGSNRVACTNGFASRHGTGSAGHRLAGPAAHRDVG